MCTIALFSEGIGGSALFSFVCNCIEDRMVTAPSFYT